MSDGEQIDEASPKRLRASTDHAVDAIVGGDVAVHNGIAAGEAGDVVHGVAEPLEMQENSTLMRTSDRDEQAVSTVVAFGVSAEACGLGEEASERPKPVTSLGGRDIVQIASAFKHTLVLLASGAVFSTGANDYAQLGREGLTSVPRAIQSLEAIRVMDVAVGEDYSVLCTSSGTVFAWGRNHAGQCGSGDRLPVTKPKLVKGALQQKHVVQVACGRAHTLLLCRTGELYGCGDSWIGNGDVTGSLSPSLISHISGAPIAKIACGESHSLALTTSGKIWSWGSNAFGALGDAKSPDTFRPNVLSTLQTHVVDVCAGGWHSLALTAEGRVLSWGKNADGQLGYESSAPNSPVPRVVTELLGTHIVAVAAGRKSSFFTSSDGRVYGAGTRQAIGGGAKMGPVSVIESLQNARAVYAGSLAAFAVFGPNAQPPRKREGVLHLDESAVPPGDEPVSSNRVADLVRMVEQAFSATSAVNGSFLDPVTCVATSDENPGIDFDRAVRVMARLERLGGKPVEEAMSHSWSRLIRNQLDSVSNKSPECLRVWLLAFANPAMQRPQTYHVIIDRLLVSLIGLGKRARGVLDRWWATMPWEQFLFIANVIQRYVSWSVTAGPPALQSKLVTAAIALDHMHGVRDVPPAAFYNDAVSSHIDLVRDFQTFCTSKAVFSWCRYPFMLTAQAKATLVAIAFKMSMEQALVRTQAFTVLSVRRSHVVEDSFAQLHALTGPALRRPLKVVFAGEIGVDEGGLTKELFVTILEQLLDPNYGMFQFNLESGKNWFNRNASNGAGGIGFAPFHFELLSMVVGLAIANAVILPVAFPQLLYTKLLNRVTTYKLDHLRQVDPELERSLRKLLSFEGDLAELGLTFSVTQEALGVVTTVPLVADGANVPVTSHNVKRYIDLYVQYVLDTSIAAPFAAFRSGFQRIVGDNNAIALLNDLELRQLVEGSTELEIRLADLRPAAQYMPPLTPDSKIVHMFWNVVSRFTQDEARAFLKFAFGSAGVPIAGLRSVRMTLQLMGGDATRLPVAHTCFNILDIPAYASEAQLESKLRMAVQEGTGFHLI